MQTYIVTAPPGFTETDAGRIHAWLAAQGIAVQAVSVRQDAARRAVAIVVEADRDPTADLAAYVPTETPDQSQRTAAIAEAKAVVAAIRAKPAGTRTVAERGVLALAWLLRDAVREMRTE
jgi:putative intracellular protease/amidase